MRPASRRFSIRFPYTGRGQDQVKSSRGGEHRLPPLKITREGQPHLVMRERKIQNQKVGQPPASFSMMAKKIKSKGGPAPQLRKSCDCYCELVSDLPAVLRLFGDWAEECTLPMLPSVCFAAGRCTSTQSSWTALDDCSRKWMSGQADALTAAQDRRRCAEKTRPTTTLRENPSPGRPPSLLDFYLSWMSPICHPICPFATPRAMNAATATRAATKTMVSKAPRPLLSKRSDTGCPIQSKSM